MKALFAIFLASVIAGCSGMGYRSSGDMSSGAGYGSSEMPLGNMTSDGYLWDANRPFPASP